jgi:hypothetical protein
MVLHFYLHNQINNSTQWRRAISKFGGCMSEKIEQWIHQIDESIKYFPKINDDMREYPMLICELGIALCALYEARHVLVNKLPGENKCQK